MLNVQDLIGLGVTKPTVTGRSLKTATEAIGTMRAKALPVFSSCFKQPGQFTINALTAGGYNAVVPAGTYT